MFDFNSINLGPEVRVKLIGQRALALVSRTSVIINTTFDVTPGTLGGFLGGYSVSRLKNETLSDSPRDILLCELGNYCLGKNFSIAGDSTPSFTENEMNSIISYNTNGPGSSNLLYYAFVLETSASYIPEIQSITTSVKNGETIHGGFYLHYLSYSTPLIPYDVSANALKYIIEANLNLNNPNDFPVTSSRIGRRAGVGIVDVTRSPASGNLGYEWRITFTTAIGNIPLLNFTNYLQGIDAEVNVTTIRDGNELGGYLRIQFNNVSTPAIYTTDDAVTMKAKLLQLPGASSVYVDRNDPTKNCNDGLCANGPLPSNGMIWTIYIGFNRFHGDITPTSPAAALNYHNLSYPVLSVDGSSLTGVGATATIFKGLARSPDDMQSLLDIKVPFSFAFGGAGASYGGLGGLGYGESRNGGIYGSEKIDDLLGGSGGSMRGSFIFDINAFLSEVKGRGGHGGGAIEIVASADIVIGNYGKIRVRGGDAEQTSEGGGGGGSGGSIVLAAAGSVVVEGELDASGGQGGYGGSGSVWRDDVLVGLSGGGGGGGRVAIYAESIMLLENNSVNLVGGSCGVHKYALSTSVILVNFTVVSACHGYLADEQTSYLIEKYLNKSFSPVASFFQNIHTVSSLTYTSFTLAFDDSNYDLMKCFNQTHNNSINVPLNSTLLQYYCFHFQKITVADISILDLNAIGYNFSTIMLPYMESYGGCKNQGMPGTLYTEAKMTTQMYVRDTAGNGAENTPRALFFSNRDEINTTSGSQREVAVPWNGPIIPFPPSKPSRVTFYVRLGIVPELKDKRVYGSLFTLLSRGVKDLNVSNVVGVFVGNQIKHGSNFEGAVDEKFYLSRINAIENYPVLDTWYKIDVRLNWATSTYNILLNDVLVTQDNSYSAPDVDGIRISTYRSVDVWYDEIYIGFDNTMKYQCPASSRKGPVTDIPKQRGWSASDEYGGSPDGYDIISPMTRHYNFLDPQNLLKFDGAGQTAVHDDIKLKYSDGDYPVLPGQLHAGALKYLSNTPRSSRSQSSRSATLVSPNGLWTYGTGYNGDGRFFWYIEHNYIYDETNHSIGPYLNGGIASCSSQDLLTWRFEGIVANYYNLSDMVYGYDRNFTMERPTVLYNEITKEYVMWSTMTDGSKSGLGLSSVWTSPYEDGPFLFRRSLFPDGNMTRDQIAFMNDENIAVLGRTFYASVEYIAPEAVMQPVWESVKFPNGSDHFSLNYHRAFYHLGYDNFHDIYLQRWRHEDQPWNITCVNRVTGKKRIVPYGAEYLNSDGDICDSPDEYKVVIGSGNPLVTSKFLNPNVSENSWWMQTSVPSVKAQPWANNYMDGLCGIRKLDDDHDVLDPELETFVPNSRKTCSNIADNPTHPTLQDKLIGAMRILTQRRAKYIALSELTADYLDTTGVLTSIEGEFEAGNLISMITNLGQFGFGPGSKLSSTFMGPKRTNFSTAIDYKYRFRQYMLDYNDRAEYALACVVDGICQNNYANHLIVSET